MSHARRLALFLLMITTAAIAAPPATQPAEPAWSEPSNGLRGRLSLRRDQVVNGTCLLRASLELINVSGVGNPMVIEARHLTYTVTDANGREVPRINGPFDGMVPIGTDEVILPVEGVIKFRIGWPGYGIPGDQAALLDLGSQNAWLFPRDGKRYYYRR